MARAPLLQLNDVSLTFGGNPVFDGLSASLQSGDRLALVGRNGSGKSTLARVITGLLPATKGDLTFAGRKLSPDLASRSKDDLREVQMIYQMADTAMNPRQTVGTIIGRPL